MYIVNLLKNEIVLYQPDNTIQPEVRLQDETVWLSQQQMVVLFESTKQDVTTNTGGAHIVGAAFVYIANNN